MVSTLSGIPFVEARNYTHESGSNGTITRIVIHDEEYPETHDSAEVIAHYFATTTTQASAHFTVDDDSIVQCVPLDCRAWHAPPNIGSIGIEHAGYASQTYTQWTDAFDLHMLDRSAELVARLCTLFNVPAVKLTTADLLAGKHGICGHADVSNAWHQSDHMDPGPNFPWSWFIERVNAFLHPVPVFPPNTFRWKAESTYTADSVARRFKVTIDELQTANPDNIRAGILKGVTINVPFPKGTKRWTAEYTFTADSVARRFVITIDDLQNVNPDNIRAGILKGVTINVPLTATNAGAFVLKG
jgi:hypothetical protein